MIIVKLIGGLGNQLFQYALGKHLSILNKTDLVFDVSEFETYKLHAYSLDHFNIKARIATAKEVSHFRKYKRKSGKINFLYNRLIANQKKYFQEKQFHFDLDVLRVRNATYLDGFWQTEKYFKDIETIIREEVTLKAPLSPLSQKIAEDIASKNAVAMHIRRADYVKNPETLKYHGACSVDYYMKASALIAEKIEAPHFFVFSDDPQWVKENIKLNFPTTYVDHNKADKNYEDLTLMSLCKHNIIANSSFSWWGAWLNRNKNKIVIGPAQWFNEVKKSVSTRDVIPDTWIKM